MTLFNEIYKAALEKNTAELHRIKHEHGSIDTLTFDRGLVTPAGLLAEQGYLRAVIFLSSLGADPNYILKGFARSSSAKMRSKLLALIPQLEDHDYVAAGFAEIGRVNFLAGFRDLYQIDPTWIATHLAYGGHDDAVKEYCDSYDINKQSVGRAYQMAGRAEQAELFLPCRRNQSHDELHLQFTQTHCDKKRKYAEIIDTTISEDAALIELEEKIAEFEQVNEVLTNQLIQADYILFGAIHARLGIAGFELAQSPTWLNRWQRQKHLTALNMEYDRQFQKCYRVARAGQDDVLPAGTSKQIPDQAIKRGNNYITLAGLLAFIGDSDAVNHLITLGADITQIVRGYVFGGWNVQVIEALRDGLVDVEDVAAAFALYGKINRVNTLLPFCSDHKKIVAAYLQGGYFQQAEALIPYSSQSVPPFSREPGHIFTIYLFEAIYHAALANDLSTLTYLQTKFKTLDLIYHYNGHCTPARQLARRSEHKAVTLLADRGCDLDRIGQGYAESGEPSNDVHIAAILAKPKTSAYLILKGYICSGRFDQVKIIEETYSTSPDVYQKGFILCGDRRHLKNDLWNHPNKGTLEEFQDEAILSGHFDLLPNPNDPKLEAQYAKYGYHAMVQKRDSEQIIAAYRCHYPRLAKALVGDFLDLQQTVWDAKLKTIPISKLQTRVHSYSLFNVLTHELETRLNEAVAQDERDYIEQSRLWKNAAEAKLKQLAQVNAELMQNLVPKQSADPARFAISARLWQAQQQQSIDDDEPFNPSLSSKPF